MPNRPSTEDPYLGCEPLKGYYLTKKKGEGRIGSVYKAVRKYPPHILACKVVPEGKLKKGWEREVEKVAQLSGVQNVVQYHSHGSTYDRNNRPYSFIFWTFIDGIDLKEYLETMPWPLDMAFIEDIAKTILNVLFACNAVKIQHGDLHVGNILISKPDLRLPDKKRTVWISDFGYGGSHNAVQPKDDNRQFVGVISNLLRRLDPAELGPRDRVMHEKMREFLLKRALEVDPTQRSRAVDPASLLTEFKDMAVDAERESAVAARGSAIKEPGDYLYAEALGNRKDEWRSLFVPRFLAAQDLLRRNITILTGARGCGKTMAFRRLTAFMDKVVGEPSGVPGSDQFVGFYMNCRDLVEAFPWLPKRLNANTRQQILHYFHLAWFAEVCRTLAVHDEGPYGHEWLDEFMCRMFPGSYQSLPSGADALSHTRAFLEQEKERCRAAAIGGTEVWPLARTDFLDLLQEKMESHIPWLADRPFYMFLDDYTIPIVVSEVQRVINPVVFKRRSKLFFKVSTEAANSFERQVRGKPLELNQDFELIDLATESIHQDDKGRSQLLDSIFRPRIKRHPRYADLDLGLEDILGTMGLSNNELARQMRDAAQEHGQKKRIVYHGVESFVGMWSSDTRTMIQMFTDMLREANGDITKGSTRISDTIQDRVCRAQGGEFLVFAESAKNPSLLELASKPTRHGEPYGRHLKDIVEAFVKVSRHEMTLGKLVGNHPSQNPKQAFRLEIMDNFELPDDIADYYEGLVRWHIFLQDWRGKSVRGMITPRLYLNRLLIPYCNLTFSAHDNIGLTSDDFADLLRNPREFYADWLKKRKRSQALNQGVLHMTDDIATEGVD